MTTRTRDLAIVGLFTLLASGPFLACAFSFDDAFFLAIARHVLADPLHPLDFAFNWYGREQLASQLSPYPPVMAYLLAAGLKLGGGAEWVARLLLLPFDLLGAAAVYLLASRFLRRPLLPALIVLAGPAYLVTMVHPSQEKLVIALGFSGLYLMVRGADEERLSLLAASSLLLAGAIFVKVSAVFLLAPCLAYCLGRRVPFRRLAACLAIALAPAALYALWSHWTGGGMLDSISMLVLQRGSYHPRADWAKQLRSVLSFAGGCGVVALWWPAALLAGSRSGRWRLAGAAAAALALFLPGLDSEAIRSVDRATGWLFSWGAMAALLALPLHGKQGRAGAMWAVWAGGVALLQFFVYWSVVARFVLFMVPPMVFGMASILEERLAPPRLPRFYLASLALTLALSLGLAAVEARYADAHKELAAEVRDRYLAQGRKVWFAGHWGLQYYLELEGARPLDLSRGGWAQVRSGDVVVVPTLNAYLARPRGAVLANVRSSVVTHPIPLRLMSGWSGQAGFFSNIWGFLPYCLSREPLEEFAIVEAL